jgi:hypothetical protein
MWEGHSGMKMKVNVFDKCPSGQMESNDSGRVNLPGPTPILNIRPNAVGRRGTRQSSI